MNSLIASLIILLLAANPLTGIIFTEIIAKTSPQHPGLQETTILPSYNIILKADKTTYKSGEDMIISIQINSSEEDNSTVSVTGVMDSRGSFRISKNEMASLKKGENDFEYTFTLPSCYGCAGVSPGNYTINCTVVRGNETLAESHVDIELTRG